MHGAEYDAGRIKPASFGFEFVCSEAFTALFHEGMDLVDEAASYLDGQGRIESGFFGSEQASAYANESMQMTNRLMQVASWLLVQHALAEGSLTQQEAIQERGRLRPFPQTVTPAGLFDSLPPKFREIVGLTARLYTRILHLEELLLEADGFMPETGNPVAEQHWLIERAFARTTS